MKAIIEDVNVEFSPVRQDRNGRDYFFCNLLNHADCEKISIFTYVNNYTGNRNIKSDCLYNVVVDITKGMRGTYINLRDIVET